MCRASGRRIDRRHGERRERQQQHDAVLAAHRADHREHRERIPHEQAPDVAEEDGRRRDVVAQETE
jgi:hypothetical protein